jgi:hypothetical protein
VFRRRLFFGLLPALLALLLHAPVAAGKSLSIYDVAAAESFRHDMPLPTAVDLATRSQRNAASIEEYFAIDDDADQYAKRSAYASPLTTPYTLVVELQLFFYGAVAPSHPPCAAPPTGPPYA